VLDADGRIVRFNKTCEAASGYAARQVVGKRLSDLGLVPLDEIDAVARAFALLRAGTQLVRHDNHWRHHDGSLRLISWTDTSLRDDQGGVEFIVGTGIDITEQRRAEEQARERLSELAHLHRVYTAGEFAALVAHEVSQPLSAISSYTEASLQGLRRGQLAPEDLRQDLEQIALQAQRAAQTIRELRNFLARREREHERVDLNELVRTAAGLLEPEAAMRKITLELDLAPGPLMVMAAPVQIEHVLVNVVQNAIDAIAAGDRTGGRVTVRTAPDGAMGRVSVQDNGPGFGDEDPERLFTRFFSTKPEGLGMGLAICRAVIDGYDGRIWAERQGKDGGLFHFTVPLAP
jgi:PAS domain S-box-containing protein